MRALLFGLLASVVLATTASAQTTAAPAQPAPAKHAGEWRVSKMIGLNVYGPGNQKIGDINEILLDRNGKIAGVVIGAGGFLGMGEHDVLVKFEDLKFVNEPMRTTSAAPANPPATNTGTGAPARPTRAANEKWYPDHAVMHFTKDQLKAMPQFKYSNYN